MDCAIEWGKAETNPAQVVRKPKQGRARAVRVLSPDTVEQIRSPTPRADP